jgi:hypothetical protein
MDGDGDCAVPFMGGHIGNHGALRIVRMSAWQALEQGSRNRDIQCVYMCIWYFDVCTEVADATQVLKISADEQGHSGFKSCVTGSR